MKRNLSLTCKLKDEYYITCWWLREAEDAVPGRVNSRYEDLRAQLVVELQVWLQYKVEPKVELRVRVSKMLTGWSLYRGQNKLPFFFHCFMLLCFLSCFFCLIALFFLCCCLLLFDKMNISLVVENVVYLERRGGFNYSSWGMMVQIRLKQVWHGWKWWIWAPMKN